MTDRPTADAPIVAAAAIETLSFDDAFAELQRVVASLEAGGGSLEAMLAEHERAVALERHCERLLSAAELRVQQLLARPDGVSAAVDVRPEEAEEE